MADRAPARRCCGALGVTVSGSNPAVVRLDGELDIAAVPQVDAALALVEGDVEVWCAGLTFIDASGISALVRAHKLARSRGTKLVLVDPSAVVVRVLGLVGLDGDLNIDQGAGGRSETH